VGKNFIHKDYWKMLAGEHIIVKHEVIGEDLPCIYKGSQLFVFPSLYEGFGLPPLEAMAAGIPVLCSNAGSLPEIVADAAVQVHPKDGDGFALKIEQMLSDAVLIKKLIKKGKRTAGTFKWEDTALKTWNIYHEVLRG